MHVEQVVSFTLHTHTPTVLTHGGLCTLSFPSVSGKTSVWEGFVTLSSSCPSLNSSPDVGLAGLCTISSVVLTQGPPLTLFWSPLCWYPGGAVSELRAASYGIGQKSCSGFSVTSYELIGQLNAFSNSESTFK